MSTRPETHDIADHEALHDLLSSGRPLHGVRLQDLDLRGVERELLGRTDLGGLVVLGGAVTTPLVAHLRDHGAVVFPAATRAPVNTFRARLYRAEDLYDGLIHDDGQSLDSRAYAWYRRTVDDRDGFDSLLQAIHDESMSDRLSEVLDDRSVIGVMGGHGLSRTDPGYAEAALLGHALAQSGHLVATGGGPGAMEAANLGALCRHTDQVEASVASLAEVPGFEDSVEDWARCALAVLGSLTRCDPEAMTSATPGQAPRSIGMPTWFYGHEPPNVFCDGIAKYFSNALREDGLLARSSTAVVALPGAAGTSQEIVQACTPLYYAEPDGPLPHLLLVDPEHWTTTIPVWPLVSGLARGRRMAEHVHLVDDVDAAVELLGQVSPG